MSEIKTGLWQSKLDGSYIKVKRGGSKSYINYNEECCSDTHVMKKKELINCYTLIEADKPAPVVDDTFNDDTPAQTFSALFPINEAKCPECGMYLRLDSNRMSIERNGMCCQCFNGIKAGKNNMRLIGIAGPARAGKDTLASYMLDNLDGFWLRSSFADPLKEMLRVIGVDCSDDAKAVIDDSYGTTPRHMMQTLGTEWGRHMIDGDIWVKAFARLNAGKCVIVPDVRFENEAELIREHGVLICIEGRGGIEGGHISERKLQYDDRDIYIDNRGSLSELYEKLDLIDLKGIINDQ